MFQGSMVALITPMTAAREVDEAALEALVGFHLDNQTDVIVAVGTTGESSTLTHDEHTHVIKRVVEIVDKKIPVIAGTGSNSTAEALGSTEAAKQVGADAALLVAPYYNKPNQEGLYQHFKTIADGVAIPQVLYNVPGRTISDILPDTVDRLASISNIVGIKEATGDMERAKELIERCADRIDIYSGDDPTAHELIMLGGKGNISVTANVAPKQMHDLCMAALAGDQDTVAELNLLLSPLNASLFADPNPIPVKWALAKMGYGHVDGIRLPLIPLEASLQAAVLDAMLQVGITVD
ncbi:MAG: 4-hydroxy-tetrahydrodipicolinate synthase [Leucothrix sp.]